MAKSGPLAYFFEELSKSPMKPTDWTNVGTGLLVGIGAVFSVLALTSGRKMNRLLTASNLWLVMSGVIHVWIEGSFVFRRFDSWIKPGLDYYASGDFRYGHDGKSMEAGTAAMEAITAVLEGPLCWLVAYAAIHNTAWRHPAQLVLTTAQIYGLIWFVLQPYFSEEGFKGHVTSDPFRFWFLVVGMNAPWGIFPVVLWLKSFRAICRAFSRVDYSKDD